MSRDHDYFVHIVTNYTGTVLDPFGNVFGVIENPHFSLPDLS